MIVGGVLSLGKPDPVRIVSSRSGTDPTSYWLEWVTPMTGGAEISNYNIDYWEVSHACCLYIDMYIGMLID